MAQEQRGRSGQRATGAQAIRLHLALALCLVICIGVGAFELSRALGGNALSWAYVVEWPILAGFGVYMWWRLLHGEADRPAKPSRRSAEEQEADAADLAAWNAYLAELHREEQSGEQGS